MKRRTFFGLVALNFALLSANVLLSPRGLWSNYPLPTDGFDCCRTVQFGGITSSYCCDGCCLVQPNCEVDGQCNAW